VLAHRREGVSGNLRLRRRAIMDALFGKKKTPAGTLLLGIGEVSTCPIADRQGVAASSRSLT